FSRDWSSDVCSSDLSGAVAMREPRRSRLGWRAGGGRRRLSGLYRFEGSVVAFDGAHQFHQRVDLSLNGFESVAGLRLLFGAAGRSEERRVGKGGSVV